MSATTKHSQAPGLGATLGQIRFLLGFGWSHAPGYLLAAVLYAAAQQVLIFFEHIYSIKFFTDAIQYQRDFGIVVVYIGLVSLGVLASLAFGAFYYQYFQPKALEAINLGIRRKLHARAAAADIACYDDPAFHNDFVLALNQAPASIAQTVQQLYRLVEALAAIAMSGVFLVLTDPVGLAFVALSVIGSVWLQSRLGRQAWAMEQELVPHQRRQSWVARVFYTADHAKEIRLTEVAQTLETDFAAAGQRIQDTVRKRSPRLARLSFLAEFGAGQLVLDGLYVLWLVWRTLVLQALGYGDLVALLGASGSLRSRLQGLTGVVGEFGKLSGFAGRLQGFLAREPSVTAPARPRPLPEGPWHLELEAVSFAYPGSTVPILDRVSLSLRSGESLALVGHNGAGKTSLVKLMMRLYDPSSGRILLNGTDIREFDPQAYRRRVGVVFQDFQLFAATVAENVAMDRLPAGPGAAARREQIARALDRTGFGARLGLMPAGLDTPVTREFADDGENLSGGEGQKLAIARVVHRDPALAILDEPSSALDPLSEAELNATVQVQAREAAVVCISHRLSTTRLAHRVCLLDQGRIAEEGTHEALMALGGSYARMFELQASRYRPPVV